MNIELGGFHRSARCVEANVTGAGMPVPRKTGVIRLAVASALTMRSGRSRALDRGGRESSTYSLSLSTRASRVPTRSREGSAASVAVPSSLNLGASSGAPLFGNALRRSSSSSKLTYRDGVREGDRKVKCLIVMLSALPLSL